MRPGRWGILRAFCHARRRARWSRARIGRHQLDALRRLPGLASARTLGEALDRLPLLPPREFAADFAGRNALGLSLDAARRCARRELETGTSPVPGYSFGLSSGTTGEPGVFLTTAAERGQWIGTILARFVSWPLLARRGGLDVALLLKHNSRLYTDAGATGRVRLRHFDLARPAEGWIGRLVELQPDILVGPPSALVEVVRRGGTASAGLRPALVLAGGEPVWAADRARLAAAFGTAPRGIYQAKEGFLAWGCEAGVLHGNEDLMVFEVQPFVGRPDRMVPVITDFSRRSQSYLRCRLDDVVRVDDEGTRGAGACACGSRFVRFAAVEGRLEDVLIRADGRPVFPSDLEATLAGHLGGDRRYRLLQGEPGRLALSFEGVPAEAGGDGAIGHLLGELRRLFAGPGETPPQIDLEPYIPEPAGEKVRPFQRRFDPESAGLIAQLAPPRPLSP